MHGLFADTTQRIFSLYGNTFDDFYTPQLRCLKIDRWLHAYLQAIGYERIVFFDPIKKLEFYDPHSYDCARGKITDRNGAHSPAQASSASAVSPAPVSARIQLPGMPVDYPRLDRRKIAEPCALQQAVKTTAYWNFGSMTDAQVCGALNSWMADEKCRTAIVVINGHDLIRQQDEDAYRLWNASCAQWSALPGANRNVAIVIFSAVMPRFDEWNLMFSLRDHFFSPNGESFQPGRNFRLGAARKDEVYNMLHRMRLKKTISWIPKQIEDMALPLAQRLLPETMAHSGYGLAWLAREIEKRPEPRMENNPWDDLMALPGLDDTVRDKLEKLVQLRKTRQSLQTNTGQATQGGGHLLTRRLSPPPTAKPDSFSSLHLALLGNPGTGKTTLAKLIGRIFRYEGILESGHTLEVTGKDLIGQYVGETAQKTTAAVNNALDGILFIDEAYSLHQDQNFGPQAITVLVEAMSNHSHRLSVIFCGYTREIEELFTGEGANPGMSSRVPPQNRWELPDYGPEALLAISRKKLRSRPLP